MSNEKPVDQVDPTAGRVVCRWPSLAAVNYVTGLPDSRLYVALHSRREYAGYLWLRPDTHSYEYDPEYEDDIIWPGPIAQQMSADTGGVLPATEAFEALRGLRPTDFLALLPGSPLHKETAQQIFERMNVQIAKCLAYDCDHRGRTGGGLWNAGCARASLGVGQEKMELLATYAPPLPTGGTKRAVVQCDPMTHEEIKVWSSPAEFIDSLEVDMSRQKAAMLSALTRAANHNEKRAKEGLHMSRHTARGFAWRWADSTNPPAPPVVPRAAAPSSDSSEKKVKEKTSRKRSSRVVAGLMNPRAKLSMEDVVKMRQLREQGMHYRQIGQEFGVTQVTAWRVLTGRTWHSRQGEQQ